MLIMNMIWLAVFWIMQIVAQVLFKFGSTSDSRWVLCFVGGNVVGVSSIWVLMKLYTTINLNVADRF